jgi:hypothetical protein
MPPTSLGFTQFIDALPQFECMHTERPVIDDLVDEHIRIGESSCPQVMHEFCKAMVVVLSKHCLRGTNVEDATRLMTTGNSRFF